VSLFASWMVSGAPVATPPATTAGTSPSNAAIPAGNAESRRTVLVTGAYRAAGWRVIATAREPDAARDLKALGEGVRIVPLDVTEPSSVAALKASLGPQPIDLLINNAGQGVGLEGGSLDKLDVAQFERVFQVNALGPVRVTQALLPN